jgi:hypothetical protein
MSPRLLIDLLTHLPELQALELLHKLSNRGLTTTVVTVGWI